MDQHSEAGATARSCPKCEMALEPSATVCGNCNHDFIRAKGEKVLLGTVAAIALGMLALIGIGTLIEIRPNAQKPLTPAERAERERLEAAADALDKDADAALEAASRAVDEAANAVDAAQASYIPGSPWTYRSTEDKVRGGTSHFATTPAPTPSISIFPIMAGPRLT